MAENKEVYQFDITGNFDAELKKLNNRLEEARAGFRQLENSVDFSKTQREFQNAAKSLKDFTAAEQEILDVLPAQEALATSAQVQARAYNALVKEVNKLSVARAKELSALNQYAQKGDPKIIQMRAEASAAASLSKQLQKVAEKEAFRNLAAGKGLQVSADGTRILNQQADAAEAAAKAVERLQLAEATRQAFAAQGLDPTGNRPTIQNGQLTAAGQQLASDQAAKKAQAAILDAEVQAQLKNNKAFLDAKKAARAARDEIAELTGTGEKTEGTFNRISFTFRRLIGIMAAFTIARTVVREFSNMISGAIRFNAEIEASRVGLAGLIAASANVRAPSGQQIGLDDQILETQNIAIDQMNKLRRDALLTAASYDELSRAFQSAVAPGLQAGGTLDEIRKVTVNISQAATALGLSQDQLAEEIRSLFTGTISARNTRIATALGISNEDIKRAKELGNLFGFLDQRFAAIARTGKLLMNTFTGQLSNAADAFNQLLAASSKPLFEQLKGALADIQSAIATATTDAVVFDPQILKAFDSLFKGLANGVKGIRVAFAQIDIKGFGDTLGVIGQALGAAATAIANAFTILFNVAAPTVTVIGKMLEIFVAIVNAIRGISSVFGSFVGGVALSAAKSLLLLVTFQKLYGVVKQVISGFRVLLGLQAASAIASKGLAASVVSIGTGIKSLLVGFGRFLPIIVAVTAGVAALDGILAAFGSDFRISDLVGGAFDLLTGSVDAATGSVQGLKEELSDPVRNPLGLVQNDFRQLKADIQELSQEGRKDIAKLKAELLSTQRTQRLPSTIAQQVEGRILQSSEFDNLDEVKELTREIGNTADSLEVVQIKLQNVNAAIKDAFSPADVKTSSAAAREYVAILKDVASVTEKIDSQRSLGIDTSFKNRNVQRLQDLRVQAGKAFASIQDPAEQKFLSGIVDLQAQSLALTSQYNALLEQSNKLYDAQNQKLALRSQKLAEQDIAQVPLSNQDLGFQVQESANAFQALTKFSAEQEIAIQKRLEAQRIAAQFASKEQGLKEGIASLDREIARLSLGKSTIEGKALAAVRQQKALREDELKLEQALAANLIARAEQESRLAQLRATGNATQGIASGLQAFAEDNEGLFKAGERVGQDIANGISQFGGQAIASAFDPRANASLRGALGDLFLSIGSNLAADLIKNLLSQLLTTLGVTVATSGAGLLTGAAAINTSALTLSAAGTEVATGVGVAGTALASLIEGLILKLIATATSIQSKQAVTTGVSAVAGVSQALGGAVNRAARVPLRNVGRTHANAPGFAIGGRPRGIDRRDTIPAWLRAGEWVIRPEAVAKYGDGIFHLLNSMKLSRSALQGISGSIGPISMPSPKRSFATGGPVQASRSSGGGSTMLSVFQFHDEQTMDRALAAGADSQIRFARARRGAYRSALNLEPT